MSSIIIMILLMILIISFFCANENQTKVNILVTTIFLIVTVLCLSILDNIFDKFMILYTFAILIIESFNDIKNLQTNTIPIYVVCALLIATMNLRFIFDNVDIQYIIMRNVQILIFAIACYCSSVLNHRHIGAGDFDIFFLVFLTNSFLGYILLFSSVVIILKHNIIRRKKTVFSNTSVNEISIVSKKEIPLVPYISLLYLFFMIAFGGGI